jgi:hypothetical protein
VFHRQADQRLPFVGLWSQLEGSTRAALVEEGAQLLRFIEPDASTYAM